MKKTVLFLLMLCVLLCACKKDVDTDYTIESYDAESRVQVGQTESTESNAQNASVPENDAGTFLVKDKTYTYGEHDVVLLDVTNETATNYTITIDMTYYDEQGGEIQTETKSFEQFIAGYQNFFVFTPQIPFADYSYTVSATEYTGEVFVTAFDYRFEGLEETRLSITEEVVKGNFKYYPTIVAKLTYSSTHHEIRGAMLTMLLFNENNELVHMLDYTPYIEPGWELGVHYKTPIIYQTMEETLTWPEQYQGEIRAIFCLKGFNYPPE